jgi:hypothetical protein
MKAEGIAAKFGNDIIVPGHAFLQGSVNYMGPQADPGVVQDYEEQRYSWNANVTESDYIGGVLKGYRINLNGNIYYACAAGASHVFRDVTGAAFATVSAGGWDLAAGGVYKINGTQLIAARSTGWTADTGTAEKSSHATYTGGTAGATYTQAEITAIKNALQDVSRGQKAIKDALIAHGLIGA